MRKTAVGMVILIILSLAFVILPPFLEDAYEVDMSRRLSCPSPGHPFGTDTLGRDVLARVVTGGRISLSVGFLVTLMTLVTALPAALACLHDGIVDSVLMRICDILKALPSRELEDPDRHHTAACSSESACAVRIRLLIVDPGRGRPQLHRSRTARRGAQLGRDPGRGPQRDIRRLVARRFPLAFHTSDRDRAQSCCGRHRGALDFLP